MDKSKVPRFLWPTVYDSDIVVMVLTAAVAVTRSPSRLTSFKFQESLKNPDARVLQS